MTVVCPNESCPEFGVPKDVDPDLLDPGEHVRCGACGFMCEETAT